MFCPNCGANNSTEQKFCRACGLNLEKSAESLLEQIPDARHAHLQRQSQSLEKFGNVALGGFGIVLLTALGAMIYGIVTKMILTGANVFFGILLIAFVIFAALSLAYVFLNESLREKKSKTNPAVSPAPADELNFPKVTGKLLESAQPLAPVPSVTEDSTALLYAENKTRKIK